jgi:hypothetical protein
MDPAKRDLPNSQEASPPSGEGARERSERLRWLAIAASLLLTGLLTVGAAFADDSSPDFPANASSGESACYACASCSPVVTAPVHKPANTLHWLIALASIGMMATAGMLGIVTIERPRQ